MKSSIVAVVVVFCALGFARSAQAQQAAPREHTMTGCLKAGTAANTFLLSDLEGTGPKSLGVVSSTANLAPHVGHKIAVTGTAVPVAEAETDPNVPKAPHYMKLTAIAMVARTCP